MSRVKCIHTWRRTYYQPTCDWFSLQHWFKTVNRILAVFLVNGGRALLEQLLFNISLHWVEAATPWYIFQTHLAAGRQQNSRIGLLSVYNIALNYFSCLYLNNDARGLQLYCLPKSCTLLMRLGWPFAHDRFYLFLFVKVRYDNGRHWEPFKALFLSKIYNNEWWSPINTQQKQSIENIKFKLC